ncbi:MAG TPA: hypothetical protein VET48_04990, partial [Steroidobacteraceae bacterium]|nr:hypothetical protein [Steroidobacteraceae bacterium]
VLGDARMAQGKFVSWNHMQLDVQSKSQSLTGVSAAGEPGRIQLVLNQAFNPSWHADGCSTVRGEQGNLVLECPSNRTEQNPINLVFHNELSAQAAAVSMNAWRLWLIVLGGSLLGLLMVYADLSIRRAIRVPY